MGKAAGYILKLNSERQRALEENRYFANDFAEPVSEFKHSRNLPLVCFINNADGYTHYLAHAKRGQRAGTELRRLNLFDIKELDKIVNLTSFADRISKIHRTKILAKLSNGGLLTPKQFGALVDAIITSNTELGELLKKYSTVLECPRFR